MHAPRRDNLAHLAAELAALAHRLRDTLGGDDQTAQTVVYGLFLARLHLGSPLTRQQAHATLIRVVPELASTLEALRAHGATREVVEQLVALLNRQKTADALQALDPRVVDPAVSFYELFLAVSAPQRRKTRGVYGTPRPVVSYIVRSVDTLLRRDFACADGLAGVPMLDPALGAGAFPLGVIDLLHTVPRLHGIELLPASRAAAAMALGLRLQDDLARGHDVSAPIRQLHLRQANALDMPDAQSRALLNEARQRGLVVMGNPPYAGHSANSGVWMDGLLHGIDRWSATPTGSYFDVDGEPLGEKNPKWLHDDYVKFIRLGQWWIEQAGAGILAVITNHGYLDNPTFRAMRRSLLDTFDELYLLDLHGSSIKHRQASDGAADENVFAIQSGVAIGLFVRRHDPRQAPVVHHAARRGRREEKFAWLLDNDVTSTAWTTLVPACPRYLFVPRANDRREEYETGWAITQVMTEHSLGILTKRDRLVVGFQPDEVAKQLAAFLDPARDAETCAAHFDLPLRDRDRWNLAETRKGLGTTPNSMAIQPLQYRPFDRRYVYYDAAVVARPNTRVMRHLARANVALVLGRQGDATGSFEWDVAYCVDTLVDQNIFRRGGGTVFPLYLYDDAGQRRPNLAPEFVAACAARLGVEAVDPDTLFHYLYAVLHSPAYRRRYADFLKLDFPRVPLPADSAQFTSLSSHGRRLADLHLRRLPAPHPPDFPIAGNNRVRAVRYQPDTSRVYLNSTQYVAPVSSEVWQFRIGGYPLCRKWLQDRTGRCLTAAEIVDYRQLVAILAETWRIMVCLDEMSE